MWLIEGQNASKQKNALATDQRTLINEGWTFKVWQATAEAEDKIVRGLALKKWIRLKYN